MLYLIIFGGLYITLVFTDFVPLLREKKKKYLWFYFPVYIVTLAANILYGLSFRMTSITKILENFMSGFVK